MMKVASKRDLRNCSKVVISVGDFDGHVEKYAESFEGVHIGNGIGKRKVGRRKLL